jgi:hemin uptake protein HemP
MLPHRHDQDSADESVPAPAPSKPPVCKSAELLKGGRLYIEHGGELYCLRLTKAGRLLLTK